MHKIRFPLGLRPRSRWGAYSAPPGPIAVFKGPTSKGRAGKEGGEGKGREREENGKGKVRGGEWKKGPQIFCPRTAAGCRLSV